MLLRVRSRQNDEILGDRAAARDEAPPVSPLVKRFVYEYLKNSCLTGVCLLMPNGSQIPV